MKIGIITAMPEETRAILKDANSEKSVLDNRNCFRCRIGGHDIMLVEAGMGMLNAGSTATALAVEGVELLVSAGFGGGVLPGLLVGDVVVAQQVLHWTGSQLDLTRPLFYRVKTADPVLTGCFITSNGILNKKDLAGLLPSDIERPVVEMESAAVAQVAAEQGIHFLGIRAISDPWDEELNFSIHDFCDQQMRIRPLKVLATTMRRPAIIPQLIRLAKNSRKAAKSLGAAMKQLLAQL
ncbi:MAG TPA: hypothetical protein VGJ93_10150 [Desulfuromonadaceae bacterium]|jgi:adenosylhomocysteine nucleosidase